MSLRRSIRKATLTLLPGKERWDVKTGGDDAAASISLIPTDVTVLQLRDFVPPVDPKSRTAPVETKIWRVTALLTEAHLESDGDIHCVLVDQDGRSMIAEIPDPDFVANKSPWTSQIFLARRCFLSLFGDPGDHWLTLGKPVVVTGTGFMDKLHGQRGCAPNGVELHPVLAIALA